MKVNIVCYQDINKWIIGKIAKKLHEELRKLSIDSKISSEPDYQADINHHLIYNNYKGQKTTVDTVMVTHVDSLELLHLLKNNLRNAQMGICMSKHTVELLANAGIERKKLSYVNLAHDGVFKPQKIVIGITTNLYADYRKREYFLPKLCERINPDEFRFIIMGEGWQPIVNAITSKGFTVDYHDNFNYDIYVTIVPTFDFYLYFGLDDGSMGFIDALAAGVPTIVTPQGFNLDAPNGLTHPFTTLQELVEVFESIAEKKRSLIRSVSAWTWDNYARKHLEIWQFLTNTFDASKLIGQYQGHRDGIYSVEFENKKSKPNFLKRIQALFYIERISFQKKIRGSKKLKAIKSILSNHTS